MPGDRHPYRDFGKPGPAGAFSRVPAIFSTPLLWARGYFCATVGAVDEKTIREYIEGQKWDEDDQGFQITAPTEP